MPESARVAAETTTIPRTVQCLRAGHGHLAGVGSLNRAHVELADDGKAPGAVPTRWYLEVGKEVWLTRFVFTGPDRPGGPPHCGHARAGVTIDRSFTRFNAPVSIAAPPDAVPAPPGT